MYRDLVLFCCALSITVTINVELELMNFGRYMVATFVLKSWLRNLTARFKWKMFENKKRFK